MRSRTRSSVVAAVLSVAGSSAFAGDGMLGPFPYLSAADSPFDLAGGTYFVEDLEDNVFDPPGVSVAPLGSICGCGVATDSVDADDGTIDGWGRDGKSYFGSPPEFNFTFAPDPFGRLPTHVGVVWTDGGMQTQATDDPAADLAPPYGVLNIFDFLAFQTAFGNGC